MTLDSATLTALANRLEEAEHNRAPITKITDEFPDLDFEDAYAIQNAVFFLGALRAGLAADTDIGFHGHHNLALGVANSLAAIEAYPWPGNVRELENRVKRSVIMADHKQISVSDLELGGAGVENSRTFNLREIREQAERQAIVRAMGHVGGKISQASELLGVSRLT